MDWGSIRQAALLIAAFAVSPVAAAQEAQCDLYKQIIAEAPSGFKAYQDAPIPERSGSFLSNFLLPGFTCMVSDGPDKVFLCYAMRPNEGVAKIGYLLETASIRRCFPDWATRPPASTYQEGDPITEESIQFFNQIDDVEISIGVLRSHADTPEILPHLIGIGVIWRPLPIGA